MSLKFYQRKTFIKALQEKTPHQILGEILHFLVEHLLSEKNFNPSEEEIKFLIRKALFLHNDLLSEIPILEEKAFKILIQALNSKAWESLKSILSEAKDIYFEIEGFHKEKNQILRPDLLVINNQTLYLIEIKLHKEDLDKEQINLYLSFLKELYPFHQIKVYLLSLEPFELNLLQEIKLQEKTYSNYGSKSFSNSTQLSLFEKFS